jgi:hypothetical protein
MEAAKVQAIEKQRKLAREGSSPGHTLPPAVGATASEKQTSKN